MGPVGAGEVLGAYRHPKVGVGPRWTHILARGRRACWGPSSGLRAEVECPQAPAVQPVPHPRVSAIPAGQGARCSGGMSSPWAWGAVCCFSCLHIPGQCSRHLGIAADGLQAGWKAARAEQGSGKNRPPRHKTIGHCSFPGRAELPEGGGHSGPVQALATPTLGPTSCAPSPSVPPALCWAGVRGPGALGSQASVGT